MVDEVEQLISEIVQIKDQYASEVGLGRRRAWPKSIKDRVARLDEIGIAPKIVSARTTIPYDTIVLWRYNRRHTVHGRLKKGFHELTVAAGASAAALPPGAPILKSLTVTVPEFKIPNTSMPVGRRASEVALGAGLRLTTPNGFIIDGLDGTTAVGLIRQLTEAGGHHDF